MLCVIIKFGCKGTAFFADLQILPVFFCKSVLLYLKILIVQYLSNSYILSLHPTYLRWLNE